VPSAAVVAGVEGEVHLAGAEIFLVAVAVGLHITTRATATGAAEGHTSHETFHVVVDVATSRAEVDVLVTFLAAECEAGLVVWVVGHTGPCRPVFREVGWVEALPLSTPCRQWP